MKQYFAFRTGKYHPQDNKPLHQEIADSYKMVVPAVVTTEPNWDKVFQLNFIIIFYILCYFYFKNDIYYTIN